MRVVTGEEMRQADHYAIEVLGMKEELLMENAGQATVHALKQIFPRLQTKKIAVLIGKGNNGGDGFVVARSLLDEGIDVDVWTVADSWTGAASYHHDLFLRCGYHYRCWDDLRANRDTSYDIWVDALLGTGMKGSLQSPYKEAVSLLNEAEGVVVSIDIPSGVSPNVGDMSSQPVQADHTITLEFPKCSAYLFPAREYYGKVHIAPIGLPRKASAELDVVRQLWTKEDVSRTLPIRRASSHKGEHGRGLLVGGSYQMPGAITLAANAAVSSGIGLLTTAIPSSILKIVANRVPESMFLPFSEDDTTELENRVDDFDAIAAGPGLGRSDRTKQIVKKLLREVKGPLILDADALYFLPELQNDMKARSSPLILTPHVGEMARLTMETVETVNRRRFFIARDFAIANQCYLVLKGPFTIVTTPTGDQYVNTTGNATLARGGTGDLLTGMILSFVSQLDDIGEAMMNAVYLHGLAADIALRENGSSQAIRTSEILHYLPLAFRSITSSS